MSVRKKRPGGNRRSRSAVRRRPRVAPAGPKLRLTFGPLPAAYERLSGATDAELASLRAAMPGLASRKTFKGEDFLTVTAVSGGRGVTRIQLRPTLLLRDIDRMLLSIRSAA